MFQDNPLLARQRKQMHDKTLSVIGNRKSTDKGYGFLEVDGQRSYVIPRPQMKKDMHGDRVTAAIHTVKNKDVAEPEALINPFLDQFVGHVQRKEN
ncbi:exoribonuclease II, partial [Morganella morganii]|nr:exoribonuclease II [Morganella morganii]